MIEIETEVDGISCFIGVLSFEEEDELFDCDWMMLDSDSRPAPWLDKMLQTKDKDRIRHEIYAVMGDN